MDAVEPTTPPPPEPLPGNGAAVERVARLIAAEKMGLVKDPEGIRLPDDLWKQALPEAMAGLRVIAAADREAAMRAALKRWHYMARRYCDGRMSYAPGSFNSDVRKLLGMGVAFATPLFARDGIGRAYDGLTDAEANAAEEDMPHGHGALEAEWMVRTEALRAERDALAERVRVLDGAVKEAAEQFDYDAEWHERRDTLGDDEVATVRRELAAEMRAALASSGEGV